jgi:uncharacterized protein (TIGR03086 family)
MDTDLLDLYKRASEWTMTKVAGAAMQPEAPTPCTGWDARTLMSHMLETQKYFVDAAKGRDAAPPGPTPPDLLSDNPVTDFSRARAETLETFETPGMIERTGPSLGIAFSDQLLHGWDLAKSASLDATMPPGLPEAAYGIIHGQFTEDQRKGVFGPEIAVPENAPAQDRLLAYTGRDPSATPGQ